MMIRVYENEEVNFEGEAEDFLYLNEEDYELDYKLNELDSKRIGSVVAFNCLTIEKIANIYD